MYTNISLYKLIIISKYQYDRADQGMTGWTHTQVLQNKILIYLKYMFSVMYN